MAHFRCNTEVKQDQNTLYAECRSWNVSSPISWTAPKTGTVKVHLYMSGRTNGTNSRTISYSFMGKTLTADNYGGDSSERSSLRSMNTYDVNVTKGVTYTSSYSQNQAIMDMYGAAWTYVD